MTVGIIGLGLIGGSLAKALHARTAHTVLGFDTDSAVLQKALDEKVLREKLTEENFAQCELLALALTPGAATAVLTRLAPKLTTRTLVFDCCGIKQEICRTGFSLAEQYGFSFFGGHPMAGTERSGYDAARAGLFDGASMILVPPAGDHSAELEKLRAFFLSLGFARLTLTTAEHHDRVIAYTSQLAHITSSAYIKSPTAAGRLGFSAGSFKDMTRVAYLNEAMWTELFLANREALLEEIVTLSGHLDEYRRALEAGDPEALRALLHDGKMKKLASEESERTAAE